MWRASSAASAEIEQALLKTLQEKVEKAKLGIDIVFLGLQGVHPPESTAQDFQDVVGMSRKSRRPSGRQTPSPTGNSPKWRGTLPGPNNCLTQSAR